MTNLVTITEIQSDIIIQKREEKYLDSIKSILEECSNDIATISKSMNDINTQGGWDSFWNKSGNIKTLSRHVNLGANIQQKTLDLLVLLMGGLGVVKEDYNIILETIEELSENSDGDIEVLNYLVKIKNTVNDLKKRDEFLDQIVYNVNSVSKSLLSVETDIEQLKYLIKLYEEQLDKLNNDIEDHLKEYKEQNLEHKSTMQSIELHQRKLKESLNRNENAINDIIQKQIDSLNRNFKTMEEKFEIESSIRDKEITAMKDTILNLKDEKATLAKKLEEAEMKMEEESDKNGKLHKNNKVLIIGVGLVTCINAGILIISSIL